MIVNPEIEAYLSELSSPPHQILKEMEDYGKQRNFPFVGPLVGRFLYSLIEFGHIHTILECGSGYGYSAAWMALALPENGKIFCIEYKSENIEKAKVYLEELSVAHKVTFLKGDSLEIVSTLNQSFDMIFNDIDKHQYSEILPSLIKCLRVGGILLIDNVLWKGKVVEEEVDDVTQHILAFNKALFDEKSLWSTIIPIRDGVSLSVKLNI
jgi:predicted O-methyltransferase YrrM